MAARGDELYRLARAAAGMGHGEHACEAFVTALLGLRHVVGAAVWVRRELLTVDRPAIELEEEATLVRLCSAPSGEELPDATPASHPLFQRVLREEGALVSLPDAEASGLVGEAAGERGRLLLMSLEDLGYLVLRSDSLRHPLASLRLDDFLEVLSIFRGALRAHFLQLELRRAETLRKRQASRIERQEEGFRYLIDRLVDIVLVVDYDTKIRFVNAATERYLGYKPEQLDGRSVLELVPAEDVKAILEVFRRSVSGGEEGEHLRLRVHHVDGRIRELDCIVHQALAGLGMTGIVMSCHDVTEVEEARRTAERASRARERFLAMMSHEVRTPMNGVLGMANLLEHTSLDGEQRDLVQTIRSSAESLLTVINEVLDFSRIESGMVEVEHAPFEPVRLVEEAAAVVAPLAGDKGLALELTIDPEVPARFTNDPLRFRQVLINLLSNAVKFTESGGIGIKLTKGEDSDGRAELRVLVTDTGIGIEEDRLETLFDPYVQADASVARRFGGTGLGLSISKQLCELMGGGINVESTPGEGSTFSFWVTGDAADDLPWWSERSFEGLEGRNVLLVSGDESLVGRLGSWLGSWGAGTVSVSCPAEAVELVSIGAPPDLAVVDARPSELGEVGLLERLQEAGIPSLLVVGGPPGNTPAKLPPEGAAAILAPPLGPYRLHDRLLDLLADEAATAAGPVAPQERDGRADDACRALVADDNPVNRKVAGMMLRQMGCRVVEAVDGEQALEKLAAEPFDLVLMDVHMPRMDGLEACRRIRGSNQYGAPRIIAMTALTLRRDIERCREAGMDGYVSKPLEMRELRALVSGDATLGFRQPGSAAAGMAGEEPVIDEERLGVLEKVGGRELVENMARLFVDHARRNMELLDAAMEAADWRTVREAAHALKGSALNLGLARLGGVARRLETLAGKRPEHSCDEKPSEMAALATSLAGELDAALEALQGFGSGGEA